MLLWEWVGVPTAPDAFLALGQGPESIVGMEISQETEIALGNVAWGKRSDLQKAGFNNNS